MIALIFIAFHLQSVFAQDGTCVGGLDPLDVKQTCLGRCHIYLEGDYGACDSYLVSEKDANEPCGDSIAKPCISTFNAGWDPAHENCGNCYYVEMAYEDGTVRSTYLKTIDTNGSETKFEMSQTAWTNLCPYLCAGTGTCGNTPEACPYGVQEMTGMPAPCAVQNAPITFKRVNCEDSGVAPGEEGERSTTLELSTTKSAIMTPQLHDSTAITSQEVVSTKEATTTEQSDLNDSSIELSISEEFSNDVEDVSKYAENSKENEGTSEEEEMTDETNEETHDDSEGSNVASCQSSVYAENATWYEECLSLCAYYATQPIHCPSYASGSGLTACVKKLHPYCG